MSTSVPPDTQPAIFTVYAWHKLEDGRRLLKTHLVAAHSSDKAERFMHEHQAGLMAGAECFITTDYVLDHLDGFGACHWYSNTITKSEPLSEHEFKRWVRAVTVDQNDGGEVNPATIRAIH